MLHIDPTASTPPFAQLQQQLRQQIASGELPPGTRLPPVRRLAGDLGLAPNTVARAYRELEASGHVVTRGRNGTAVRPAPDDGSAEAARLAERYLVAMAAIGFDHDDAVGYLRRAATP